MIRRSAVVMLTASLLAVPGGPSNSASHSEGRPSLLVAPPSLIAVGKADGRSFSEYAVATDEKGRASALWIQGGVLKSARADRAGTWGRAVTVACPRPAVRPCASPQLALTGSGAATAVWEYAKPDPDGLYQTGDVGVAQRGPDGTWTPPEVLAHTSSWSQIAPQPQVAASESGAVVLTYDTQRSFGGPESRVALYRRTAGPWSHAARTMLRGSSSAAMAMSPDGTAVLVGYGYEDVAPVRAYRYQPRHGWLSPRTLGRTYADADIAVAPNGSALAVWWHQVSSSMRLRYRWMSRSGRWGPARSLTRRGWAGEPRVVIDGNGVATVAWDSGSFRSGSSRAIRSARAVRGRQWRFSRVAAYRSGGVTVAHLAVNAQGSVVVTWYRATGVTVAIRPAGSSWSLHRRIPTWYAQPAPLPRSGALFVYAAGSDLVSTRAYVP